MAKRTGKDLAFSIGGVTVAVMRDWDLETNDVDVESTAAGDATVDRDSLRSDFTVNFNALVEIASPYVLAGQASLGSKVAFVGRIVAADTNGIVAGTAKLSRLRIGGAYDGLFTWAGTLIAAGTALTWDLTPA